MYRCCKMLFFFQKIFFRCKQIKETCLNLVATKDLFYIVDNIDWSIKHDGVSITSSLTGMKSRLSISDLGIYNSIIHYGSINSFYHSRLRSKYLRPSRSNKLIVTWFHVVPNDPRIPEIMNHIDCVDVWHTSCEFTKNVMTSIGIPSEKIVVIPLGVNTDVYKKNKIEKAKFRLKHRLDKDTVVIGSFQKDGVGWGRGLTPKLIKGPDIFCEVLSRLKKEYKLFIVLTGPARGYVIDQLEKMNVSYIHNYLDNPDEVSKYYKVIDLYMVTSRVEGGPKSILEAMSSEVPLISTEVGMAPDIITHHKNGFLVPIDEVDILWNKIRYVIANRTKLSNMIASAYLTAQKHDWKIIAKEYQKKLYSK